MARSAIRLWRSHAGPAIVCAALLTLRAPILAQDVHFAQFSQSPLAVNPAQCGAIENDQRLALNYRDQWSSLDSPYRTYAASYDLPVMRGKLNGRYLGIGAHAYSDKAGAAEWGTTNAGLSIAYDLPVTQRDHLAFGMQGAYGQRSAQLEGLRWDSQYTGSNYDPTLPTGEAEGDHQVTYLDLAAGLLWRRSSANGNRLAVGAAVYHPHQPDVSLIGTHNDPLLRRYTLHGEMRIESSRWTWSPKLFAARQGGATEILVGGLAQRRVGSDSRFTTESTSSAFNFGLFYRVNDALVPMMMFEFRRLFTAAVSYDVNISRLQVQTNYQGGLEVSLVYHGAFSDKRRKVKNGQAQ